MGFFEQTVSGELLYPKNKLGEWSVKDITVQTTPALCF